MSVTRRAPPAPETTDWGTDALTGLIAPSVRQSQEAGPAPARPAPSGANPVRLASYALLAVLLVGAAITLAGGVGSSEVPRALAAPSFSASAASSGAPSPKLRPRIDARQVDNPSRKAAALALSRGDYREALGQYRALGQLYPEESAYRSLIRVLERRLTPKTPDR